MAVVELIAAATTKTGLTVACVLDPRLTKKASRSPKPQCSDLAIEGDAFHPEWNYVIKLARLNAT